MPISPPARRAAAAETPIALVKAILLAYEKYGIDPAEQFGQAQISPALLDDPNARITARQMEIFTAGAMRILDDETLGWFSRRLPWGTYGLLCRASLSSPNLGIALRRWFRHHRLITDDIRITLSIAGGRVATVCIEESRQFGNMREFCLLTYLRFVHGYACWVIDSRIPLLQVGLPFPAPPHENAFRSSFPGPVAFDAPKACFSFDAKYLDLAHQRDEHALQTMLQRPLPLTMLPYRRDRLLVQRVRKLLTNTSADISDAEALAKRLNVSSRTMYRQLRDEGTSFQQLKDEVRHEQAIRLLSNTDKQIKQIAAALGFSSDKSFARAFRQWSGETPVDYRRRVTART